ncbi:hypothetical protein J1N35_038133 [Gossypium stocksii]|uniref:Reverse transcriptase zinc-binding domain-containing protein n=1 Tax=Gossypium stocksii TaxID=47602 RepID=A0A9D3UM45_9ROSI|nr:hypothetical protein J1N35_038133 [Gossypium stocksii]
MVIEDGRWSLDLFRLSLSKDIVKKIVGIPHTSFYRFRPIRVKFFIWVMIKERLLTNIEHVRRGEGAAAHVDFTTMTLRMPYMLSEIVEQLKIFGYSLAKQYASICKVYVSKRNTTNSRLILAGNWIKLNMDGAVWVDSGFTTAGGVMHDMKENWILEFNRFLGVCSVLEAKLWGIFKSLSLLLK